MGFLTRVNSPRLGKRQKKPVTLRVVLLCVCAVCCGCLSLVPPLATSSGYLLSQNRARSSTAVSLGGLCVCWLLRRLFLSVSFLRLREREVFPGVGSQVEVSLLDL